MISIDDGGFVIEAVDPQMAGILRQKTPADRLAISWGLWTFVRDMIRRTLRSDHPDWTDEQIGRELAWRMSHGVVPRNYGVAHESGAA